MRTPVILTHRIPTAEEVARRLGVSPERTRELIGRAEEIYREDIARRGKPKAIGKGAKNGAVKKRGGRTSTNKK